VRLCGQKFRGYPQFLFGTYCIMRILVFMRCCPKTVVDFFARKRKAEVEKNIAICKQAESFQNDE